MGCHGRRRVQASRLEVVSTHSAGSEPLKTSSRTAVPCLKLPLPLSAAVANPKRNPNKGTRPRTSIEMLLWKNSWLGAEKKLTPSEVFRTKNAFGSRFSSPEVTVGEPGGAAACANKATS